MIGLADRIIAAETQTLICPWCPNGKKLASLEAFVQHTQAKHPQLLHTQLGVPEGLATKDAFKVVHEKLKAVFPHLSATAANVPSANPTSNAPKVAEAAAAATGQLTLNGTAGTAALPALSAAADGGASAMGPRAAAAGAAGMMSSAAPRAANNQQLRGSGNQTSMSPASAPAATPIAIPGSLVGRVPLTTSSTTSQTGTVAAVGAAPAASRVAAIVGTALGAAGAATATSAAAAAAAGTRTLSLPAAAPGSNMVSTSFANISLQPRAVTTSPAAAAAAAATAAAAPGSRGLNALHLYSPTLPAAPAAAASLDLSLLHALLGNCGSQTFTLVPTNLLTRSHPVQRAEAGIQFPALQVVNPARQAAVTQLTAAAAHMPLTAIGAPPPVPHEAAALADCYLQRASGWPWAQQQQQQQQQGGTCSSSSGLHHIFSRGLHTLPPPPAVAAAAAAGAHSASLARLFDPHNLGALAGCPDEVLAVIFSFVGQHDRKALHLVNKHLAAVMVQQRIKQAGRLGVCIAALKRLLPAQAAAAAAAAAAGGGWWGAAAQQQQVEQLEDVGDGDMLGMLQYNPMPNFMPQEPASFSMNASISEIGSRGYDVCDVEKGGQQFRFVQEKMQQAMLAEQCAGSAGSEQQHTADCIGCKGASLIAVQRQQQQQQQRAELEEAEFAQQEGVKRQLIDWLGVSAAATPSSAAAGLTSRGNSSSSEAAGGTAGAAAAAGNTIAVEDDPFVQLPFSKLEGFLDYAIPQLLATSGSSNSGGKPAAAGSIPDPAGGGSFGPEASDCFIGSGADQKWSTRMARYRPSSGMMVMLFARLVAANAAEAQAVWARMMGNEGFAEFLEGVLPRGTSLLVTLSYKEAEAGMGPAVGLRPGVSRLGDLRLSGKAVSP